jgi:hypothetical protein
MTPLADWLYPIITIGIRHLAREQDRVFIIGGEVVLSQQRKGHL